MDVDTCLGWFITTTTTTTLRALASKQLLGWAVTSTKELQSQVWQVVNPGLEHDLAQPSQLQNKPLLSCISHRSWNPDLALMQAEQGHRWALEPITLQDKHPWWDWSCDYNSQTDLVITTHYMPTTGKLQLEHKWQWLLSDSIHAGLSQPWDKWLWLHRNPALSL